MPHVRIDDIEFHTEDVGEETLEVLEAMKFIQGEIERLQKEIRIYHAALRAHKSEVEAEVKRRGLVPIDSDDAEIRED